MSDDEILALLEPRIVTLLEWLRKELLGRGIACGPTMEAHDEEFCWMLVDEQARFGVRLTILEEEVTEGNGNGVALSLVGDTNDETLFSYTPHNFTSTLWVPKDKEAILERWEEFTDTIDYGDVLIESILDKIGA